MTDPGVSQSGPCERTPREALPRKKQRLWDEKVFAEVLGRVPDLVLVLDRNRQVVYANRVALAAAGLAEDDQILGLRPGELLACNRSTEKPGGCGEGDGCAYCGALQAILTSQQGRPAVGECRLIVLKGGHEEALDLRVWASPIEMEGEPYTFLAAVDISHEKRRAYLDEVLLPELAAAAKTASGFASLLAVETADAGLREEVRRRLGELSGRITEEIGAQRQLVAAETGALRLDPKPLRSVRFLRDVLEEYDHPAALDGRRLAAAPGCDDMTFESDPVLLGRILRAMITNGLEASVPGEAVTVGCRAQGDGICFWVRSASYMPEPVRRQVFQRSFSTKGPGRGLGAYTMKILGERYLGGKVTFTSTEKDGTVFAGCFPLECPRRHR